MSDSILSEKRPEQMTVSELRAELTDINSWAHDFDDRIENGEIQHGRPLRHRELCAAIGWLMIPIGVPGNIERTQRMTREHIGGDSESGPLRKEELREILETTRSKIEEQQKETDNDE